MTDALSLTADAPASAMPAGTLLLEVDNAIVRFGTFTAVNKASLKLHAGNLLGLIGPNGAGKTTLMRAIAALQPLTSGTIRILGRARELGDEEAARMIGFTPDVPPAYEALTVRQFLAFIAAGYGIVPEDVNPRIDFWLEKVWLQDKKHQKIRSLSRGMRQRLGIARTLLPDPQIVLLDEPASGLDPAGRVQFRKLLADLRDQGKTLVVSSHILSDMEEYCTHAAIMSHGTVMQFGTVREIAAGVDNGRCRYTILLASPVPKLSLLLESIEGVSNITTERLEATVEFGSDRLQAAELLRELHRLEIPVAGFSGHAAGLEEAYLRTGIRQVD